jgi:peptidoglycan/xylan/chitin deacetylase (PgdA/CDA1 family)
MNMRIKAALCGWYKYSGILAAQELLARWAGHSFLVVLVFHRVTDEIPEDGLTIGCAHFRAVCRLLAQHFRVVSLAEIFRLARNNASLPPRTVAITFDDCYRDNLAAARVLAEHGLPATFFVPTAYLGTDHVFPWDRHLKRMPNLTWEDLHEMHRLGFEIGSHTATHADLGAVSREEATREIVESKAILEDRLGGQVRWLAYPYGGRHNFRSDWLPLLKAAGYEGCVSAFGGYIHPGMETDVLPRVAVPPFASNLHLEIHLRGGLIWYHALKRRLGLGDRRVVMIEHRECDGAEPCRETGYTSLVEKGAR